jgi:flagellar motor switch protein FliM
MMTEILRRKLDLARQPQADGAPGADRGWRLALARAARDAMGLELEVQALSITRASLAEVLELAPDQALIGLLGGPKDALGVMMLAPEVTAAVIEMQTLGRLSAQPATPRKPTRIDAAMVAGVIDQALQGLEETLAKEADLSWAGGFRYASHLADARPLGLMLEDEVYRVLSGEVRLGNGGRSGRMILVLPALGRGDRPTQLPDRAETAATGFAAALSAQVHAADCRLEAVIGRVMLQIRHIMALQPGEVLAMPQATLDSVVLEGADGRPIARARLGQNRGMRALKVQLAPPPAQATPATPQGPGGTVAATPLPDLRAAG